ncbi:hypothetical protein E2K80_10975 [Rhodophyticola sp. CCM32]|uniref:hypothetical protein n=1 Tax=Rhodophyticola sp. CCM32 TaxID=2916397 RepID=UPI00107F5A6B|nr:hypothetical protein [Rhodophyticola sp. CCM32]QBY01182.1 hypothetical protein E2K80_10975 [Rhodophyticola sp. CCM32]
MGKNLLLFSSQDARNRRRKESPLAKDFAKPHENKGYLPISTLRKGKKNAKEPRTILIKIQARPNLRRDSGGKGSCP